MSHRLRGCSERDVTLQWRRYSAVQVPSISHYPTSLNFSNPLPHILHSSSSYPQHFNMSSNIPSPSTNSLKPPPQILLIPWDPASPAHVEPLVQQRHACGWDWEHIETWKEKQSSGLFNLQWLVCPPSSFPCPLSSLYLSLRFLTLPTP
jgi:hypothetical protein